MKDFNAELGGHDTVHKGPQTGINTEKKLGNSVNDQDPKWNGHTVVLLGEFVVAVSHTFFKNEEEPQGIANEEQEKDYEKNPDLVGFFCLQGLERLIVNGRGSSSSSSSGGGGCSSSISGGDRVAFGEKAPSHKKNSMAVPED